MNNECLTTCPICAGTLVQGKLRSRGSSFFLPDGEKTPILYGKDAVKERGGVALPPDPLGGEDFPSCCLCRSCRMIFLPCPHL